MKTETRPEQPVLLDAEARPEDAVAQPTTRRVAYKTVLATVVVGVLSIGVLWMFVTGPGGYSVDPIRVTTPDIQAHQDTKAKGPQVARIEVEYGAIDHRLASLSDRIDRGYEAQQTHRSVVKRELSAMAEGIRAIEAGIADLRESSHALGRRISEAISRLDTIAKEVRALKVVKRKPILKNKPHPVKNPPFQLDAIDVWDDVTYVAISQAGRVAFLGVGEQQSGWTVTHIDRLKGRVDFQGPAGQVHSVSVQR